MCGKESTHIRDVELTATGTALLHATTATIAAAAATAAESTSSICTSESTAARCRVRESGFGFAVLHCDCVSKSSGGRCEGKGT